MQQLSFSFEPAVDEIDICIMSGMKKGIPVRPARLNEPQMDYLVGLGLLIAVDAPRKLQHPGISSREYRLTDVGSAWTECLERKVA